MVSKQLYLISFFTLCQGWHLRYMSFLTIWKIKTFCDHSNNQTKRERSSLRISFSLRKPPGAYKKRKLRCVYVFHGDGSRSCVSSLIAWRIIHHTVSLSDKKRSQSTLRTAHAGPMKDSHSSQVCLRDFVHLSLIKELNVCDLMSSSMCLSFNSHVKSKKT